MKNRNILVIDDDLDILNFYKMYLEDDITNVITAEKATDAISIINKNKISLIFSDHYMADLDGTNLCDLLKEHKDVYGDIPFIIVSGFPDSVKDIQNTCQYMPDMLIEKPFDPEKLKLAIDYYVR